MIGIYTLKQLQAEIAASPQQWRPLVFTNGCFDLLHAGHVRYLKSAKSWGQALVVGLNSDQSVRTLKPQKPGFPPRPLIPQQQRAEVVAALKPVDGVVIFPETTATQVIDALKPEIYVKGGDYTIAKIPEAATVQVYGGQVKLIQVEVPSSTTAIVSKILQTSDQGNACL